MAKRIKLKKPDTARIFYQGPSFLPGSEGIEIIGVITFGSKNKKTGNTWTIYYFPSSVLNVEMKDGGLLKHLIHEGNDKAACLGCIHGSQGDQDCYVLPTMFKGNSRMIEGLQRRGQDAYISMELLLALLQEYLPKVRFGGYGDPVSLPLYLSQQIVTAAKGNVLGYTHAWNRIPLDDRSLYAKFLMASVDSEMQAAFAQAKGWRTFRVGQKGKDKPTKAEFNCPASKEMKEKIGKVITCEDCGLCKGQLATTNKSTFILSHGAFSNRYNPLKVLVA